MSAAGTKRPVNCAFAPCIGQLVCIETSANRSGVAGRFCLSHRSQGSPTDLQTIEHQSWQEPQALDYRSHSYPMDIRGASQVSVNPSQWPAEQSQHLQESSQSEQQQSSAQRPPLHAKSSGQSVDSPKSSWRHSLDHDQAVTTSFDSRSSAMTSSKKRQTVLIWDLDETLILFHSLLSGVYASHHSPEVLTNTSVGCLELSSTSRLCLKLHLTSLVSCKQSSFM